MKENKFRTLLFTVLLIVGISFTACQDEYVNESSPGRLKIELTDAPFPTDLVTEANVTISKMEIRKKDDVVGNPYITLSEDTMTFNLLDLTNGITETLVDMEFGAGSYDQIRLYVSEASIKLSDETEYNLFIPSGEQSGIKVFINPSIFVTDGLTAELLLDFDVSKSFVLKGNPNTPAGIKGFNFKPVITATNTTAEVSTAGTLSGKVTDPEDVAIEGAQVAIMAADTVYKTSFTDDGGEYTVQGVEAGTYKVEYSKDLYLTTTIDDVEVTAGDTTTQDAILELE